MSRVLVLALALTMAPILAKPADAQMLGGPMASAPSGRGGHWGGRPHRRLDPVTRWRTELERARARGNVTGREPWNSYTPASAFGGSHFPRSELMESGLWPEACWEWRADCGGGGFAVRDFAAPRAVSSAAVPSAAPAPPAFAPPAVRSLDTRPTVRGAGAEAPRTYAHRVWRP